MLTQLSLVLQLWNAPHPLVVPLPLQSLVCRALRAFKGKVAPTRLTATHSKIPGFIFICDQVCDGFVSAHSLASQVLFLIHAHKAIWTWLWSCNRVNLSLQRWLNGWNVNMIPTVLMWQLPSVLTFHHRQSGYWIHLREALILLDASSLHFLSMWNYLTYRYCTS